jgi:hypothetical protein
MACPPILKPEQSHTFRQYFELPVVHRMIAI